MADAKPGKTTYKCSDANDHLTGCKVKDRTYSIPEYWRGPSKIGPLAQFLAQRFFDVKRPENLPAIKKGTINDQRYINYSSQPERHPHFMPVPDNLDIAQAMPVRALKNLRARQEGALESIQALYVNGEDPDLFEAFRDSSLRSKWRHNVGVLINSGDWKKVVYRDMPDGEAKTYIRQKIEALGIDPETFNVGLKGGAPSHFLATARGVTALGDPKLPEPPHVKTRFASDARPVRASASGKAFSSRKSKKSSNAPILLGAAALGFLALKGRK